MITVHRRLDKHWLKLSEDDDTEFLVRPLNSPTMIDIRNEIDIDKETGNLLISGAGVMAACRAGLVDWKGVVDEKGEPLPFAPQHIEWLPVDQLKLLAVRILANARVTEDERKNS